MAKPLLDYRAKRDFTKTAEPSGDRSIKPAQYPRFVIQKHDATRLHYDLRLEVEGTFRSWAVTKGPSRDPADKRLAVEVEDHPLDYGDFEGTIPEGEYGGGTVMLWDRGFWSPVENEDPAKALAKGELKFNLAGEKIKGSYVLVRMKFDRTGGKRTNWLLIKHKDQWAKPDDADGLLKKDRSVASGRTMTQIANGKGGAPTPFMLGAARAFKPDAIWHSDPDKAGPPEPRKKPARKARSAAPRKEKSGPPPAISSVTAHGNTVLGITISKPEKVLWPGEGGSEQATKRDLAEYLATVGPWMIGHLKGRPCSVIRAPDGIKGQQFFQRHAMQGANAHVELVKVSGDREPYLQIDTVEGLVAMGQLAALEFHPWNCAPYEPEIAGRLIFDLDPAPDVPFSAVVDAAKEIRERLERLGLVTFCKTTGGKGLHVVTPLDVNGEDAPGWDQAKMFAHAVSAQMAEDSPAKYLIKMTKAQRKGRIFIDYLRNDTKSTAVAPLSPRARPGATVSMPLTWAQVRTGLDPKRFTIATAPTLMQKSRPWNDYHAGARPLRSAISKLVG